MTKNQIDYWNYKEVGRHNLATEAETNRHNVVSEEEVHRHNLQTELLTSTANAELQRHNRQGEIQAQANLSEQVRSNKAQEALGARKNEISYSQIGLGYAQLGEAIQHNRASEATNLMATREQVEHNEASEALGLRTQAEVERANSERERENQNNLMLRSTEQSLEAAKLKETTRHNKAEENLESQRNLINFGRAGAKLLRNVGGLK